MKRLHYIPALLAWLLLQSCTGKGRLFLSLSPEKTGIGFQNTLKYDDSLTVLDFEYMFNGAGVALIDINRDGLPDVYFTGNMTSSRLYLNKGNLRFEDITESAGVGTSGWCYGASVVDINQDGFPDIYVCKAGNHNTPADSMRNLFFINNGNNSFTESAAKMGLDDDGYDVQAAFLDYDHDGDLDMYLLRNGFVNYNRNSIRLKQTEGQAASTDRLFRNNGNGTFSNVSESAGIRTEGFGLGVSVCDINNDGWPDLYVSNDFLTNDLLWLNNRNGTFSNAADKLLRHTTYNAMGNDVADFNNDGKEDIVEVDMLPPDDARWKLTMMGNTWDQFQLGLQFGYQPQYVRNSLQLNNGDGHFSEIGRLAGVSATEWSWAPLLADFDNDGWKDLFVANGYRQDVTNLDFVMYGKRNRMGTTAASRKDRVDMLRNYPGIKIPDYLFHNNRDLTFTNLATEWGITDDTYSNGAVYGDLDNDGDLDLVINNLDQPASVYENRETTMHPSSKWLRLALKGATGNRDGFGAKIYTWQGTNMQYEYASPCRGYLSSVDEVLHFGFGEKAVDSLKIVWPDGRLQIIHKPKLNKLLTLSYADAQPPALPSAADSGSTAVSHKLYFETVTDSIGIRYRHIEDGFVDFKIQPLMPHLLSHEGPGVCVGDVNADGLEDFFVGAAAGSKASLFLQTRNGSFIQQVFPDSNRADNMGCLLFDADGDGDNDLFVVHGGLSEKKNGEAIYQPALYLNDGSGHFTTAPGALPVMNSSGSSVVDADYDHDGDLDLFLCGRVTPGKYPLSPSSFLLRNESDKEHCRFSDVTKAAGINGKAGMVSSALWTDFDNDGWPDLLLAGEFMPLTFLKNSGGHFSDISSSTGMQHTGGWWNSLAAADFDGDGDIDYVAGNLGLNGPYKASATEPVCIYAADYDKNGTLDPVMCHYYNNTEYTVHSREDMIKQMPPMRARFSDFASYAGKPFSEAFRKDEVEQATVVRAETFASAWIENLGGGKFSLHSLPLAAQFSPIYAMLPGDYNGDGYPDVFCVGNSFSPEVQSGRYDAQGSLLLLGDGKGNFFVDRNNPDLQGDNKSLARLSQPGGRSLLLVGTNSGALQVLRQRDTASAVVVVRPEEKYAFVTMRDGHRYRQEFYFGSSYLSQSSRSLMAGRQVKTVSLFDNKGGHRELSF